MGSKHIILSCSPNLKSRFLSLRSSPWSMVLLPLLNQDLLPAPNSELASSRKLPRSPLPCLSSPKQRASYHSERRHQLRRSSKRRPSKRRHPSASSPSEKREPLRRLMPRRHPLRRLLPRRHLLRRSSRRRHLLRRSSPRRRLSRRLSPKRHPSRKSLPRSLTATLAKSQRRASKSSSSTSVSATSTKFVFLQRNI